MSEGLQNFPEKQFVIIDQSSMSADSAWINIGPWSTSPESCRCMVSIYQHCVICIWWVFQQKHKHAFTIFITPPHWHDMCSWNLPSYTTGTYLGYMINIIAADDLVVQGARASATIMLNLLNRDNSVPTPKGLTNWGPNKMVQHLRMTFKCSFLKMLEFWLEFH